MKNVRRRKDGRWEYRKCSNGETVDLIAKTLKQLLEKKREYITSHKMQKQEQKIFKNYVLEWYYNYKPNISEKTKECYNNTLNNYIIKQFGDYKLSQLKTIEIQNFINQIKFKRTKQMVIMHLKAILTYLFAQQLIKIDIAKLIVNNKTEQDKEELKKPLTILQQQKLLDILNKTEPTLKKFIIFSIILGTRRNETLQFKLKDINGNNILIHGTKTINAKRTIKISNSLVELLNDTSKKPDEQYFDWTPDNITEKVNKLLKPINKKLTLHCLRKTCSTNMHYLGIADKIRQQVLGHASIITTNNIYTFLEYDIKKEDIIALYNNLYYEY